MYKCFFNNFLAIVIDISFKMTSNEGDSSFVDLNLFSNDSNAADVTEPLMSELFEDCEEVINDSEFLENKSGKDIYVILHKMFIKQSFKSFFLLQPCCGTVLKQITV